MAIRGLLQVEDGRYDIMGSLDQVSHIAPARAPLGRVQGDCVY